MKKSNSLRNRIISLVIVLLLLMSIIPLQTIAADVDLAGNEPTAEVSETVEAQESEEPTTIAEEETALSEDLPDEEAEDSYEIPAKEEEEIADLGPTANNFSDFTATTNIEGNNCIVSTSSNNSTVYCKSVATITLKFNNKNKLEKNAFSFKCDGEESDSFNWDDSKKTLSVDFGSEEEQLSYNMKKEYSFTFYQSTYSFTIIHDNKGPEISFSVASYPEEPQNGYVQRLISYTVSVVDGEDGIGADKTVSINGNEKELTKGTFTYKYQLKEEVTEIQAVAKDKLGNSTESEKYYPAAGYKFDTSVPQPSIITKVNADEWFNEDKVIEFSVPEDTESGLADESKFFVYKKGSPTDIPITKEESGKYSFTVKETGNYQVQVQDNVGNVAFSTYGEQDDIRINIDKTAPEAKDIHIEFSNTEIYPVISFLTFGLYGKTALEAKVSVKSNGESPISSITYGGEEKTGDDISEDDGTYTATFVFEKEPGEDKTTVFDLILAVEDKAGNDASFNMKDLGKAFSVKGIELEESIDDDDYKLIISNAAPKVSDFSITAENTFQADGNTSYKGIKKISFTVSDGMPTDVASLKSVSVKLDNVEIKKGMGLYGIPTDDECKNRRIASIDVEYDAKSLASLSDGKHTVTVNATNSAGNTMLETIYEFYVNTLPPQITIIDDFSDEWTNDVEKGTFTFTVTENTEYTPAVGIKEITVTGALDNQTYTYPDDRFDYDESTGIYIFHADKYQSYKINAVNNLGTPAEEKETKTFLFDNTAPQIDSVEISCPEGNLNYLPFGIYANAPIEFKISMSDEAKTGDYIYSSGFDENVLSVSGFKVQSDISNPKSTEESGVTNTSVGTCTVLMGNTADMISLSDEVKFTFSDISGNEVTFSLDDLLGITKINGDNISSKVNKNYEIIATGEKTVVSNEKWAPKDGVYEFTPTGEMKDHHWFSGYAIFSFAMQDEISKISNLKVTLNDNDITDYIDEEPVIPKTTPYTDLDNHTGEKVIKKAITIDTSKSGISQYVKTCSGDEDGQNKLSVVITSNNGLTETIEENFYYVDQEAPIITAFDYADPTAYSLVDEEGILINPDKSATFDKNEEYGYYFPKETQVKVTASDFMGSGVKTIVLELPNTTDVRYSKQTYTCPLNEDGTGKRDVISGAFTIPANYKGEISAYAVDMVENGGINCSYYPYQIITETEDNHKGNSGISISVVEKSVSKDHKNQPLYNQSVTVKVKAYSKFAGIAKVEGVINSTSPDFNANNKIIPALTIDNKGILSDTEHWKIVSTDKNLVTEVEGTFVLDGKGAFNVNDIICSATVTDRATHSTNAAPINFSIDTTPPKVEVTYAPASPSNTYGGNDYYSKTRVATVKVTERNFDTSDFVWAKTSSSNHGNKPSFASGSNWNSYSDYTDASTHVATLTYSADDDYTVIFDCTDMAKNKASVLPKTEKFTIDQTKPEIKVSFDNNSARNGAYYNANRTATVTIIEHNFATVTPYLVYSPQATAADNSTQVTPPSISGWSTSGDTHTATISFTSDGKYSFTIEFKDLALNTTDKFTEPTFYIDTKVDGLEFLNVTNLSAYDNEIAPGIDYKDYNLGETSYKLVREAVDLKDLTISKLDATNLTPVVNNGSVEKIVSWNSFEKAEINDGVYTLTASMTDKAGNEKSDSIMFSVNRFGSTFVAGNKETSDLLATGFTRQAPEIVIKEINVNKVTEQKASLSYNSDTQTLAQGDGYKLTHSGDGEKTWYESTYTIAKDNFANEGDYNVTLSSKDAFKKTVSNRTANVSEETDRTLPIAFTVDSTTPQIVILGVKNDEQCKEAERTITITCDDSNIDPSTLEISVDDKLLSKDTDYQVEEKVGGLEAWFTMTANGSNDKHTLHVTIKDKAGNVIIDEVKNFVLAATFFARFFHNTLAVVITSVVLALIIAAVVFLIIKKKKNK